MPMLHSLDEAQNVPFRRRVFQFILKLANAAILIVGIFTNMLTIEINPNPTFCPGMLLMALGGTTMLGSLLGFGSYESPFYYKSHVITMSMAIFGTAVFCLTTFGQRSKVAASFKSPLYSDDTMDHYLSSVSWMYAFVVGFESVALFARVLFQRMGAHEHFETLSETGDVRAVAMGNMRQDIEDQSGYIDQTRAERLDSKNERHPTCQVSSSIRRESINQTVIGILHPAIN